MLEQPRDRPSRVLRSARPFGFLGVLILFASSCSLVGPRPKPDLRVEVFNEVKFGPGQNRLQLELSASGVRHGTLLAYLEIETPSGRRLRSEARWQLPRHMTETGAGVAGRFEVDFQAPEEGMSWGRLRIYDPDGGLLFVSRRLRFMIWPRLDLTQNRSYYTHEEELEFKVRLNPGEVPPGMSQDRQLRVELRDGAETVREQQLVFRDAGEVYGRFSIAGLAAGEYSLVALLEGSSDSALVAVRKLDPAPSEVKIDLFTKSLLRNGEPFFPVGLYWLRSEALAEARRLHFNSGDYYYKLEPHEIADLMEAAGRRIWGFSWN